MPFFLRFPSFPRPYQSRIIPDGTPTAYRRHTDSRGKRRPSVDRRSTVGSATGMVRARYGGEAEEAGHNRCMAGGTVHDIYTTYIRHIYVICMPYARHMHVI